MNIHVRVTGSGASPQKRRDAIGRDRTFTDDAQAADYVRDQRAQGFTVTVEQTPSDRFGEVIEQRADRTVVRYGDGITDTETLMGITRSGVVAALPVGASVRLTYRTGANYGLWFGEPAT